ncbi:UNVERIFIED_CONTAM: hypothetical protein RMT77_000779 [Armadillidium vulgare]
MTLNKPILYSNYISSCSYRVRIALALKNIDYEYCAINLQKGEQKNEELLSVSPKGEIPVLVVNGAVITQSMSILQYIDEVYPEVPLLPNSKYLRAKVREICQIISSGIQPLQKVPILKTCESEKNEQFPNAVDCIQEGFTVLEKILKKCSGKYCLGDTVTLADCCLVPQVSNAKRFNVDIRQFGLINKINENLLELEAFQRAHPSSQPDCPPDFK